MRITYTPLPREEVLAALGPHWPPQPGAPIVCVGDVIGFTHGAVAVHDNEDRPGTTWWAIDGLIVPQDAGPPPAVPGCPTDTVPAPETEHSPPVDPAPTP